jgi:hypothetical protein
MRFQGLGAGRPATTRSATSLWGPRRRSADEPRGGLHRRGFCDGDLSGDLEDAVAPRATARSSATAPGDLAGRGRLSAVAPLAYHLEPDSH